MRHSLDPRCPCDDCMRGAFEHRAVTLVIVGLIALGALAYVAGRLWADHRLLWADHRLLWAELAVFRAQLDRTPPRFAGDAALYAASTWRSWFAGGEYLGERSARTGPDPVGAAQPCGCEVCENGRQNARVGSSSTNGTEGDP